jgi:predicted alpha/beta hydrolase family esterase
MVHLRLPPRRLVSAASAARNRPSWEPRTEACWSTAAEDLVLFVHGFGGASLTTWRRFMDLWPVQRGDDLVFYGYESLRRQVHYMAIEFGEFLDGFLAEPARVINPTVAHLERWYPGSVRRQDFAYRRVVVVAHSLGAVVARRALLNAERDGRDWLSGMRMVLFAPAHKGAYISKLVFSALTGVTLGVPIASVAKLYFKSLEGLEQNSTELRDLEQETVQALAARRRYTKEMQPLAATQVVIPEWESIVIQGQFAEDAGSRSAPGCTHTTVCKPREEFPDPLHAVADAF